MHFPNSKSCLSSKLMKSFFAMCPVASVMIPLIATSVSP